MAFPLAGEEMRQELQGHVSLITGASSGMGSATAAHLASQGASVVLVARNSRTLNEARDDIVRKTGNRNLLSVSCDVAKTGETRGVVDAAMEKFGRIDSLLLFAGYNVDYGRLCLARPDENLIAELEAIVNTDLLGSARLIFQVEPLMRRQKRGVIVTIGNTPLLVPSPGDLLFQVAKIGNKRIVEVLAEQHRVDGFSDIRCYCLAPGFVANPSTIEGLPESKRREADKEGWLDSSRHIAPVVSWLLTERIRRPSGTTLKLIPETLSTLFKEAGEKFVPEC